YIQLWDTSNGKKSKLFQSGYTGFVSALTCFPESGHVASTNLTTKLPLAMPLHKFFTLGLSNYGSMGRYCTGEEGPDVVAF
ncbi:hypothetical protein Tco_0386220, partial [Tanacetum coccineum]